MRHVGCAFSHIIKSVRFGKIFMTEVLKDCIFAEGEENSIS